VYEIVASDKPSLERSSRTAEIAGLLEWSGSESNRRPPACKASPVGNRHLEHRAHLRADQAFRLSMVVSPQHSLTGPTRDGLAAQPDGSHSLSGGRGRPTGECVCNHPLENHAAEVCSQMWRAVVPDLIPILSPFYWKNRPPGMQTCGASITSIHDFASPGERGLVRRRP